MQGSFFFLMGWNLADLIAMATVWLLRLQRFIWIERKIDISGRHGLDFSLDNCEIAAIMRTNGECVLSMKIPNRWWMKETMKKRNLYLICACIGLMLLTACTSGGETSADASAAEGNMEDHTAGTDEIPLENEQEETAPEQDYEYPSEDAGSVREESRLGYAMTYDPTVFTLDDTGEDQDIYTYHTSEALDGRYISRFSLIRIWMLGPWQMELPCSQGRMVLPHKRRILEQIIWIPNAFIMKRM
jgi:hypothetical protein